MHTIPRVKHGSSEKDFTGKYGTDLTGAYYIVSMLTTSDAQL